MMHYLTCLVCRQSWDGCDICLTSKYQEPKRILFVIFLSFLIDPHNHLIKTKPVQRLCSAAIFVNREAVKKITKVWSFLCLEWPNSSRNAKKIFHYHAYTQSRIILSIFFIETSLHFWAVCLFVLSNPFFQVWRIV